MREAAGDLVPLLEDRETASAALHGLERLGTAAQADALVLYLESPRAEMHRLALEALWKVKPEAGVAALPGLMARGLLSAGYLPDAAQAHLRTAAGMRRLVEVKGRPPRVLLELCDSLGSAEASRELLFLLKDRNPGLRREALRVFARLGTFPSGGGFLECLKDPASSVRCEAASALCRMGRREGVAVLLAEAERWTGVDLNVLNALRRPEEWKKLESARLKEQVSGPIRTLVPKLVEQAGFRLVWPKETVVREWRSHEGWAGPGRRIVDALLDFLHGSPCEMVLEAGEVRLIPSHEAPAFWRGALK